jgi:predicted  nucleic acid-binding Zn-ribbon protein
MYIIIKVKTDNNIPDLEGEFETLEESLKYMNDKMVNNQNKNSYIKNISQSELSDYYEKENNYFFPNRSILKYKYRIIKLNNHYFKKPVILRQPNKKSYKDAVSI